MARARNIKPGFFKNEILGKLDPIVSLLFISLWTLADRVGRLEDRPERILAETFPYRRELSCINGYLTQLLQHGFIDRYKVDGKAVIQIVNFRKHQTPHSTEKPSELPEKPADYIPLPLDNGELTQALPPDSLNHESGIMNPDSLNPEVSVEANASTSSVSDDPPKADRVPYQKIIELYHEVLPMCPEVKILTHTRKSQIAARWKSGAIPDLDTWRDFFIFVSKSDFLTGKSDPPPGRRRFVADLEWLTKESNFVKIYERKYHAKI